MPRWSSLQLYKATDPAGTVTSVELTVRRVSASSRCPPLNIGSTYSCFFCFFVTVTMHCITNDCVNHTALVRKRPPKIGRKKKSIEKEKSAPVPSRLGVRARIFAGGGVDKVNHESRGLEYYTCFKPMHPVFTTIHVRTCYRVRPRPDL